MKHRQLIIIFSVVGLPIIAYVLTRFIATFLSMSPNMVEIALISIAIWAILLIVPYLILKVMFHNTPAEKDLHAKDLPDDQPKTKVKYPKK